MTARLLDGRAVAAAVLAEARREVRAAARRLGRAPRLAIVAADGPAAASYAKSQVRACASVGLVAVVHRLSPGPRAKTLGLLADVAADAGADAVLVETPYPRGLTAEDVAGAVPARKDAEGVTEAAYGRLFLT
ncbi:MAG: bifunctional 5,10-methylene-tetrahydrofolate dehydrogenase/5,10-methylene-tetrahydrofolate cyclohydrolase, partial [Elusimicrobia bacterium]|nr:bifunctional 5,10-methylene-tetrahydrofolate dehydrogenase/5,10-methylene-tetrahydrofolate cyclohydrolase [Elusimicrobiota bacterium]